MTTRFEHFEVSDVRFPTSRALDGSDAMNKDPDYSAAYVVVHTTGGDEGHGFVFTIGRGNEVAVAAIRAVEPLVAGLDVDEVLADMGGFWRLLTRDSQLRWLGPEKGVTHMAIGAVVNAVWDLYARRRGVPLWKLLSGLSPGQIVELVDFRYLSDVLDADEALDLLTRATGGKEERERHLLAEGYPAYTTSAGWLGYSDEKVLGLVRDALAQGFTHLKLKVGADIDSDVRRVKLVRELVRGHPPVCRCQSGMGRRPGHRRHKPAGAVRPLLGRRADQPRRHPRPRPHCPGRCSDTGGYG